MDKEFVLVSQGIEIYRTKSQEVAVNMVKKENDKYFDYRQRCVDNYERPADNYIDLEIEYPEERLIYKKINELQQKFDNVNEYKKEDLLLDINLYQETFDEPLFASEKVEE